MNKEKLKSILNKRYNRSDWQGLINGIFPNVSMFATPREIPITEKSLEGRVESFLQLGSIRLHDETINIFELKINNQSFGQTFLKAPFFIRHTGHSSGGSVPS